VDGKAGRDWGEDTGEEGLVTSKEQHSLRMLATGRKKIATEEGGHSGVQRKKWGSRLKKGRGTIGTQKGRDGEGPKTEGAVFWNRPTKNDFDEQI